MDPGDQADGMIPVPSLPFSLRSFGSSFHHDWHVEPHLVVTKLSRPAAIYHHPHPLVHPVHDRRLEGK